MPVQENSSKKIDPSTLNFNKIEGPNSQKLRDNTFSVNLHVRNSFNDLVNMIVPRGIGIKSWGHDIHRNRLTEGCLVTVYCNNINPNELCRREHDELMNFVNTKLKVIRDNPYELKGLNPNTKKIITEIDNEEKADKAFNLTKDKETGKVYGQL